MTKKRAQPQPQRRPLPQAREGYVAVGWIRAPRGLGGELKVDSLTDFPQRFAPGAILWIGEVPYAVRRARPHLRTLLLELEGIDTREQAETLRDLLLELPESELAPLEEHQYYRFQILGIEVTDLEGKPLGRIEDVLDTGANDVYIVRDDEGDLLVPAIDTVVKEVDVEGRRMVVELPKGLERKPIKQPKD